MLHLIYLVLLTLYSNNIQFIGRRVESYQALGEIDPDPPDSSLDAMSVPLSDDDSVL